MDGMASHILTSTIDANILNSLPVPNIEFGEQHMARDIYGFLRLHYGSGDYNSIINVETRLRKLFCGSGPGSITVQEYITTYRLLTNEMHAAGYPLPPQQILQLFADGLPTTFAFVSLWQSIYFSLDEPNDNHLLSIESVYAQAKVINDMSRRLNVNTN